MQVQCLGQEDPLGEGMATHSNILAWKIPWTEDPGELWSIGSQRVRQDRSNLEHTHSIYIHTHIYIYTHIYTHMHLSDDPAIAILSIYSK